MIEQEADYYTTLKSKFDNWLESEEGSNNEWAKYLMYAPDLFHILCRLSIDPDVPVEEKAKLGGAIAYFVTPIDLVPEAIIGPIGYVDDIALASYVLNSIVNGAGEDVVKKHWDGDCDLTQLIQDIIKDADTMIGSSLWVQLREVIK